MSLQQTISYKDPAGYVVKLQDGYFRYISASYSKEYDHLMQSGLYESLTAQSLLVSHAEVELESEHSEYYKKIFPRQLDFISYPFEWSYSQWKQMILSFISINELALKQGMILKDASPYNFTFDDHKCVLIDTLSFGFYKDGDPWVAYRQFCEETLSPFLLMYYRDPMWAKLYRANITGLPLPFVSRQLPFITRFNPFCLIHIHLHSSFQNGKEKKGTTTSSGLNAEKLNVLFGTIRKNVLNKNKPLLRNSIWEDYYQNDIESERYIADKISVVTSWLTEAKPNVTIDLGANTGKFSEIASPLSNHVYAVESDIYCVDEIYMNSQVKKNNITTIVADLADPSPGLGWSNNEKSALLKRLKGDMVMALALIHHLCLGRNLPLEFIADLFSEMTTRFAIVEFVPKTDPKSELLLQHKGDIFRFYTEEDFINAFEEKFKLVASHSFIQSQRKLFLWEKL